MDNKYNNSINRRQMLKGMGMAGLAMTGMMLGISKSANAAASYEISMQLGWLATNGQLGEIIADAKGFYADEGLTFKIIPGGPNVDGVASVASGRAALGQLSSSPSLMMARAAGIPVKCIAAGYQQHPFTYFSLDSNPVRTPKDLIGKKIGTNGTARILLRAMLAKNGISESDVEIIVMGGDVSPLLTGQVDVISGWQTNLSQLKVLGDKRVDMRLWDAGIELYANPYYATEENLAKHQAQYEGFLRATSRGWAWAYENQAEAVEILVKRNPNMDPKIEAQAVPLLLDYVFNAETKANGWGAMTRENWQAQISIYDQLGQFKKGAPSVDDIMTTALLEATANDRAKIG
ncbi:MAG: ABC transporter substrate-binding protein [Amphritea sp.]